MPADCEVEECPMTRFYSVDFRSATTAPGDQAAVHDVNYGDWGYREKRQSAGWLDLWFDS